jgi:hypothetical protein
VRSLLTAAALHCVYVPLLNKARVVVFFNRNTVVRCLPEAAAVLGSMETPSAQRRTSEWTGRGWGGGRRVRDKSEAKWSPRARALVPSS